MHCIKDSVYIEDGINGVKAGIAAGCRTIMIPDLIEPTEEIMGRCAGIYPSLLDALDAIRTEGPR